MYKKPTTAILQRHAIELSALARERPENEPLKLRAAAAKKLFHEALEAERKEESDETTPAQDAEAS